MVNFKKLVAILCSATMVLGAPITAFATEPTTTPGTGNIVAYSIDTVTVPTEMKVSFNPQGWTIYYDDTDDTGTTKQIVSLNYAVSSMATMDRKFTVSFTASGTPGDTGSPVVFVNSADEVAPKTESNPNGAELGEFKVYLAVAGATDKVTESRDGTAFEISSGAANITGALLADVTMTPATDGLEAFVANTDGAESSIAFKLGKATYELKDDAHPSFDTTQTDFAGMVQPATLGDIVGFTFTGAMNSNADWTKANLSAISIEPEYEFEDVDGTEEEVASAGYNQITTVPTEDTYKMVIKNGTCTYRFATAPTGTITALTVDGKNMLAAVTAGNVSYANGTLTFNATATTNMSLATGSHTVKVTIGNTAKTLTVGN